MDWRSRWEELTIGGGAVAAAIRWWLTRRRSAPGQPGPLQRLMRWVAFAKRLETLESAEHLTAEKLHRIEQHAQELAINLDFFQTQNNVLRAEIRRLHNELDQCSGSGTGSTAMPGTKSRRRKRPPRRSGKPTRSRGT